MHADDASSRSASPPPAVDEGYFPAQPPASPGPHLVHRKPAPAEPDTPRAESPAPSLFSARRRVVTSHLLRGPVDKPWLAKRDPWARAVRYTFLGVASLGLLGAAAQCYFGYKSVPHLGPICLVLSDDFSGASLDTRVWQQEVALGGWGNGEFEWTTASPNNTRVQDGVLYLVPTLTADVIGKAAVFDGFNYTAPDCTQANFTDCNAVSNATKGTVINPVQSARITTRLSRSIRYGRVEVRAKMPTGDWLWPAIWMLPVNSTYGEWPRSGEIDIVEARGNPPSYPAQGSDWLTSTLHWGPAGYLDQAWRTVGWWNDKHTTFDAGFHTYVLEWDESFIWMYIDSRINRIFNFRFNKPFFSRGKFGQTVFNGSQEVLLTSPWAGSANTDTAPFDEAFYLILNVAVGGTNGWFPDGKGSKPWVDGSTTAMRDFAKAQDQWYPTWPADFRERALAVDYVKMWQKC